MFKNSLNFNDERLVLYINKLKNSLNFHHNYTGTYLNFWQGNMLDIPQDNEMYTQ